MKFRENGNHYNGGAEFFGYGYTSVDDPRITMIRRWYRRGERKGKSEDRFFLDGEPVSADEVKAVATALESRAAATEER